MPQALKNQALGALKNILYHRFVQKYTAYNADGSRVCSFLMNYDFTLKWVR